MSFLICSIHKNRPEVCRSYPQPDNYIPESCGYYFSGDEKKGTCYLECQAACCSLPRRDGEPGGAPLPEIAGGMPCKHLEDVDTPPKGAVVERPED